MVGKQLRHQSAVDVSVVGMQVTEEIGYKATLYSLFEGESRRERKVEGVLQKRYLDHIRPEYSRTYRVKDSITVSANPEPNRIEDNNKQTKRDRMFSDQNNSQNKDNSQSFAVTSHGQSDAKRIGLSLKLLLLLLAVKFLIQ